MTVRPQLEAGQRVFPAHPQVDRYFPSATMENARRRLIRSIERGDGPCVMIGSAGTGKSLLMQVLAAGWQDRFDIVMLACASLCTRRALLQAIHFELGLEYRLRDEGRLRLSLMDQLLASDQAADGLLLLVDEAQALPVHLIEELRVLTNLVRGGQPRVRLVLAGLPPLEETLAGPELESFSQRLAARCYLGKLTRDETTQYVRAHLAAAGLDPERLFAADAWPGLYDATDGVPRLVNQLCEQTLVLAAERKLVKIDRLLIQAAWAELQQLPMPSEMTDETTASASGNGGVIEFGSLDDDDTPGIVPPTPMGFESSAPPAETSVVVDHEDEVIEPTELDEEDELVEVTATVDDEVISTVEAEHPAPAHTASDVAALVQSEPEDADTKPAITSRRPRVFDSCVPEAVDPFNDRFDEEEMVLESFGALSAVFHSGTPQVENQHDPAFARLLDVAIRASTKADARHEVPKTETRSVKRRRKSEEHPTIRLAVLSDSPPLDADVAVSQGELEIDEELEVGADPITSDQFGHVPETATASASSRDAELMCDSAEAVLIIEDEPVAEVGRSGDVRCENYSNLFTRLRHGT